MKAIMVRSQEVMKQFNRVRGYIISEKPEEKITDEKVLRYIMEEFENGRRNRNQACQVFI